MTQATDGRRLVIDEGEPTMITSLMAECVYEYCLDVKRPPTQTARCERCSDTYLVEYKVLVDPDGTRRKLTCPHRACYPLRYHEYMSLPGLRYCKLQHFPDGAVLVSSPRPRIALR